MERGIWGQGILLCSGSCSDSADYGWMRPNDETQETTSPPINWQGTLTDSCFTHLELQLLDWDPLWLFVVRGNWPRRLRKEGAQTQSDSTPGRLRYWDIFHTEQVFIKTVKLHEINWWMIFFSMNASEICELKWIKSGLNYCLFFQTIISCHDFSSCVSRPCENVTKK